jgi:hypothetical protein
MSESPCRQATASSAFLRSLLVLGCLLSAIAAASLADSASLVRADPQLALLLRGMALIKGTVVLAACALLFWRFGHPVRRRTAAAYIFGTGLLSGASMLIWQLSYIPFAALVFHAAACWVLIAAWRDGIASSSFSFLRHKLATKRTGLPTATFVER